MRRWLLVVGGVLVLGAPARAEVRQEDDPGKFRVGVNLGIVSIPRLINVEGYARVHPYIGLSGGWSTFPKFASDAILKWAGAKSATTDATLNDFSAWEVALRIYPMRGVFFVGVGFGQQVIEGTVTELQAGTPFGATALARVESWVMTPRLGWQWVWSSGFAMGVDLGVQFVLSHKDALVAPGAPPDVVHDAQDLIDFGASKPLPVINFRIGYHFG